jgi:hypothetical protein
MAALRNAPKQDTKTRFVASNASTTLGVNTPWIQIGIQSAFLSAQTNAEVNLGEVIVIEKVRATFHAVPSPDATEQRGLWVAGFSPGRFNDTESGAATAVTNSTLTKAAAGWTVGQWTGFRVIAANGAGAPRYGIVVSNTTDTLTIASPFGSGIQWKTETGAQAGSNPSGTSNFILSQEDEGGVTTAVSGTTLTDSTKAWAVNQWAGWVVVSFDNAGTTMCAGVIRSNTATALTLAGDDAAGRWSSNVTMTTSGRKYVIQPGPTMVFVDGHLITTTSYPMIVDWDVEVVIPEGYRLYCFSDTEASGALELHCRIETTSAARSAGLLSRCVRACWPSAAASSTFIPQVPGMSVVVTDVYVSGNPLTGTTDLTIDYVDTAASDSPDLFVFPQGATILGYEYNHGFRGYFAGPKGYGLRATSSAASSTSIVVVYQYDDKPNIFDPRGVPQQAPEVAGTHDGTVSTTVVTDPDMAWPTDYHRGKSLLITEGPSAGEMRTISSNTGQTITVGTAFSATLTAASKYAVIGNGDCGGDYFWYQLNSTAAGIETTSLLPLSLIGKATGNGLNTRLDDSGGTFTTDVPANILAGYTLEIIAGTNAGESRRITSNAAGTITVTPAFSAVTDATCFYVVRRNGAPTGFTATVTGTATAGTAGTLTDTGKSFAPNSLVGSYIFTLSGASRGIGRVVSNTATVVTYVDAFPSGNASSTVVGGKPTAGAGVAYAIGNVPSTSLQALEVHGYSLCAVNTVGGCTLANGTTQVTALYSTPLLATGINIVGDIRIPMTGLVSLAPLSVASGPGFKAGSVTRAGMTIWGKRNKIPSNIARIRPPFSTITA